MSTIDSEDIHKVFASIKEGFHLFLLKFFIQNEIYCLSYRLKGREGWSGMHKEEHAR